MKIAVLGAGGQLAHDLLQALAGDDVTALTHSDVDVTDFNGTSKIIADIAPELVFNTAAFHQVDLCEDDVEKAFEVNAYAVRNLAEICLEIGATLVHVSTDYVFDGTTRTPYSEEAPAHPLSVYGVSKLAGEEFVRAICPRHFIIRGSGLYGVKGASGKGGNFVETMIRVAKEGRPLRVVNDQVLGPTYTKDMAAKILEIIDKGENGLYHVTNSDQCSWFEFTGKILELAGLSADLAPTTTEAYGLKAKRPSYSVLENGGVKRLGLAEMRPWHDALQDYMKDKGHIV